MQLEVLKSTPSVESPINGTVVQRKTIAQPTNRLPSVESPINGTVVLCHGAWHGAWCFEDNLMPFLSKNGYNCLAPSYRNHGNSAKYGSLKFRRIREYVEDIHAVVSGLEGKIYLIGHSMGGLVVQKYLEKYGKNIEKAVLLASAPPHGVWRITLKNMLRYPLSFLKANLTFSLKPYVATPALVREHFFSKSMSEEQVVAHTNRIQDESYLAYLDMLLLNLPKVSEIKTPILVIGGEDDYIFNKKDIVETAKAYATEGIFFKNKTHNIFMEDDDDAVKNCILAFLNTAT